MFANNQTHAGTIINHGKLTYWFGGNAGAVLTGVFENYGTMTMDWVGSYVGDRDMFEISTGTFNNYGKITGLRNNTSYAMFKMTGTGVFNSFNGRIYPGNGLSPFKCLTSNRTVNFFSAISNLNAPTVTMRSDSYSTGYVPVGIDNNVNESTTYNF